MRFNFCGEIKAVEDQEKKGYFYRRDTTSGGDTYHRVNLRVASAKNNSAFIELFGMENDIMTRDSDNGNLTVPWEDRNDADVIKSVASYKQFHILDKTYIAAADVCTFIKEHIDELKNGKYAVTGQTQLNEYNGKFSDQYMISNIYSVDEDRKQDLLVTTQFFFTADSFDDEDWKSDKRLYINGWTQEYFKKSESEKGMYYYPRTIVFDCSKVNFEDKKQVAQVVWRLKQIGCESKGGTIKCKLNKKNVYEIPIKCRYINGAEEIQFDESELSDNQKEAIELGIMTLEDCIPKDKKVYGQRITELRLFNYDLSGDFADGCKEATDTKDEFEEKILSVSSSDDDDDFSKNMNPPTGDDDEVTTSIDDLF